MNIKVGNSYRVVENRDSHYGGCNDIKLIEGKIVKVINSDINFSRETSFDVIDEKGIEHCCEACNLTEINNNKEKKVMKKILKVLCMNNGFYDLIGRKFCTEGREYKVISETDKTFTIMDDGEYENEIEFKSNKWFELLYEEKESVVVKRKFKAGDKIKIVKDVDYTSAKIGDIAVIREVGEEDGEEDNYYLIKLDKNYKECFTVDADMELITEKVTEKFKIITEGTTTTVRFKDGRTGTAKLFHEDSYSKGFGFIVAAGKAMGIDLVSEVLKVVKSYDKPTKEEIKEFANRTALTGNKIGVALESVLVKINKFQVGDIIKGIDKHFYIITNTEMEKARVININEDETIRIEILEHADKYWITYKYNVNPDYFKLVETPSLKQTILKEKIKTVFKIGDLVTVKVGLINNKKYNMLPFFNSMNKYVGKSGKITGITSQGNFDVEGLYYTYSSGMLELVEKEEFNVGDKICRVQKGKDTYVGIYDKTDSLGIWADWNRDDLKELPKTVSEFNKIELDGDSSFISTISSIKKLILIDDTKSKNPVIRW